jgi:hypothetical protein
MADKIFLLSLKEYKKYRDQVSHIHCWWWLRSPGYNSSKTVSVYGDGTIYRVGNDVGDCEGAVRPAIAIPKDYEIGERILAYDFPWIVIDKGLAIAEVPIGIERFDRDSNSYQNSEIRQWLLNWMKERI